MDNSTLNVLQANYSHFIQPAYLSSITLSKYCDNNDARDY